VREHGAGLQGFLAKEESEGRMGTEMSEATAVNSLVVIRARVDAAFAGFIGNEAAVHAIKRSLVYALANAPVGDAPSMAKSILLVGAPSTGKSDLARRITKALRLPFVHVDGHGVRSRDRFFQMVDDALSAANPPLLPVAGEPRSGMPVQVYPPFLAFIDEIHLVSDAVQESFLTLLESDVRSLLLESGGERRIAAVPGACFIFATTRPAELERAFRSRCIEIQLTRYTVEEVALMVRARFSRLPDQHIATIASCSRMTPRVAFAIAQDVVEEVFWSADGVVGPCVKKVLEGRGIVFANGCTRDDIRYLKVLRKERRPLGERALRSLLHDIDPLKIVEDIEPFLFTLGYAVMRAGGREITMEGIFFLRNVAQNEEDKSHGQ
jgi:Holliday junction resolvasome RuvABC ATP-dependent DNA helicase subunit